MLLEFFTLLFARGITVEFERQQVSPGLQDFPQYSSRSQQFVLRSLTLPVLFTKPLMTVPSAPCKIGITDILVFHGFLSFLFSFSLIIIILLLFEFFPPAFADGFSIESEWQQVSSSLQDSS